MRIRILNSLAKMSMHVLVAKCVMLQTCNYAHFKEILLVDILVDKMLCGQYLADVQGFLWWSIFDKTPVASLGCIETCF